MTPPHTPMPDARETPAPPPEELGEQLAEKHLEIVRDALKGHTMTDTPNAPDAAAIRALLEEYTVAWETWIGDDDPATEQISWNHFYNARLTLNEQAPGMVRALLDQHDADRRTIAAQQARITDLKAGIESDAFNNHERETRLEARIEQLENIRQQNAEGIGRLAEMGQRDKGPIIGTQTVEWAADRITELEAALYDMIGLYARDAFDSDDGETWTCLDCGATQRGHTRLTSLNTHADTCRYAYADRVCHTRAALKGGA